MDPARADEAPAPPPPALPRELRTAGLSARGALLLSPHALAALLDVSPHYAAALLRHAALLWQSPLDPTASLGPLGPLGPLRSVGPLDLPLPCGCAALDAALRGGLPRGAVTELCGAPGACAESLALSFALSVPPGRALWIAADGAPPDVFPARRALLSRVAFAAAASLSAVAARLRTGAARGARLIVVDGLPLLARRAFRGANEDAAARHEAIARLMQCAKAAARAAGAAVVFITRPGAALGRAFAHAVNARLRLRRGGAPGTAAAAAVWAIDVEKSAVAPAARVECELDGTDVVRARVMNAAERVPLMDVAQCCADPAGHAIVPTVVYC